jgi:hypothetical protein
MNVMECYISVRVDFFKMNFSDGELIYSFSNTCFVSWLKAGKYSCLKCQIIHMYQPHVCVLFI